MNEVVISDKNPNCCRSNPDNNLTDSKRPKAAGNKAFKLHNRIMFLKTLERRKLGRANKT
jgi:hypothetical protein